MKQKILPLVIAVMMMSFNVPSLCAQTPDEDLFSLHFIPGVSIPMGEDAQVYTIGGAASLLGRLSIPGFPYLSVELAAGYTMSPINSVSGDTTLLNILSGRLGLGFRVPVSDSIILGAHLHGGYFYGFLNVDVPDNTGNNPLVEAGAEVTLKLSPALSLGLDASYRMFFGLTNDVLIGVGLSYHFPSGGRDTILTPQTNPYPELELLDISFNDVFPVFYKYYADHPLGKITLRNKGTTPVENVTVKIYVNQYMDNPEICQEIKLIPAGGREQVELFALFNDRMLSITENTKVQINISVESTVAGEQYGNESVQSLRIFDRNAMTWEDDRRAAAFVSIKDPAVQKFAKNVTSYIKDKASKAINKNFLTALAFFETMRLYGMSYAVDPTTPFTEFSRRKNAVDFLQFPNQSLEYKAGDCDDLSILYAALLESVGVKTAFITTPGHIYVAVNLDMTPYEAGKQFANSGDFIFKDNQTWLPVEITLLSRGFLEAWQEGSKLWKEENGRGRARMIPLEEAWKTYEPVGFTGGSGLSLPAEDAVVSAYLKEVMKYIDRDLYPQTRRLEEQIRANPNDLSLQNKLGILYARYGVYDKAEAAFKRILDTRDYAPALVNMGNVAYLRDDLQEAKRYYERAHKLTPNDTAVLLNLAKVNYDLGQYRETEIFYVRLRKRSPELAGRFAYLSMKGSAASTRSAEAESGRDRMVWGE